MTNKQEPICEISADGDKKWYLNGKLHREDAPAIEFADGTKEWFLNGKLSSPIDAFKQANDVQRRHMICYYAREFSR